MLFLEVKNLSINIGREKAVENVSFEIKKGENVAIIGPNGAGKTTILRALLGSSRYQGEVIWHEKPIIGYVPQKFDFDKTVPFTVEEFFLVYSRKSKGFWFPSRSAVREIEKYLKYVKADHLLKRNLGEISHGELQRVLIAQAIFERPNILLLDEPTASVDVEGERTIYYLVKEMIKDFSLTSIIISHDLHVVHDFADRVICLNRKMLCEGSPDAVLNKETLSALYGGDVTLYKHEHKQYGR